LVGTGSSLDDAIQSPLPNQVEQLEGSARQSFLTSSEYKGDFKVNFLQLRIDFVIILSLLFS
jgi:hypothetical protein